MNKYTEGDINSIRKYESDAMKMMMDSLFSSSSLLSESDDHDHRDGPEDGCVCNLEETERDSVKEAMENEMDNSEIRL